MNRTFRLYRRWCLCWKDAAVYAAVLGGVALCIATGVIGPTMDARAEQHASR
jgi:hypothetical protein